MIPLTAPKLKEMAGPNTPFGNFIHNPTEDNIKVSSHEKKEKKKMWRKSTGIIYLGNKMIFSCVAVSSKKKLPWLVADA